MFLRDNDLLGGMGRGGEIGNVKWQLLAYAYPILFSDLVEELHTVIHDALDQRKGDVSHI